MQAERRHHSTDITGLTAAINQTSQDLILAGGLARDENGRFSECRGANRSNSGENPKRRHDISPLENNRRGQVADRFPSSHFAREFSRPYDRVRSAKACRWLRFRAKFAATQDSGSGPEGHHLCRCKR